MKYLKLFETNTEFQEFINSDEFIRPNVTYVKEVKGLSFEPSLPIEKELPYLTMTALEDDLTVSLSTNPCQYSLNGTEWNELQAGEQTPSINTGEKIYFKGSIEQGSSVGTFTVSKRFNLSGNVMSMIFCDEAEGKTDLTGYNGCFDRTFQNCTGLEKVSKNFLPATTLADGCYALMFGGCASLINTPELPATTLAEGCYAGMFASCTSLIQVSELPATTLAASCYNSMFQDCTSLETAPELPATTLADDCYDMMFMVCTSLINAPELPATSLTNYCYGMMFMGCTSLNHIKMLATDISAQSCLSDWVYGVSETGTFVKSADATWDESEVIPEGWTVETV